MYTHTQEPEAEAIIGLSVCETVVQLWAPGPFVEDVEDSEAELAVGMS